MNKCVHIHIFIFPFHLSHSLIILYVLFVCLFFQTFRHGLPYSPTALAYDPVQKLLAIGDKSGSLRM